MAKNAIDDGFVKEESLKNEVDVEKLDWFRKRKFGMFIHWGLYSELAGSYKGKSVDFIGEWIMRWLKIPYTEYRKVANDFNPVSFNAEEWMDLAKEAGMGYVVITAKHHDGFAMYKSDVSKYNICDASPYKKDPMVDLSYACKERDIKFGFYYSHAQDWDEKNAFGNDWDFGDERDYDQYLEDKAIVQIEELLSNYGDISLIWFDTPVNLKKRHALELVKTVRSNQENCLVNNRVGYGLGDYLQMADNEVPSNVFPAMWESPATLNDTWGYKVQDTNWKDSKNILYRLIDIVSKGGNYLLNIGPDGKGIVPKESCDILREVGSWLKINGEAIYESTHSMFSISQFSYRTTTKPYTIYVHFLDEILDEFELNGLKSEVLNVAWLHNENSNIEYEKKEESVVFKGLNNSTEDNIYPVMKITIKDKVPVISKEHRYDASLDKIVLRSFDADPHGPKMHYDKELNAITDLWEERAKIRWTLLINEPGIFSVKLVYRCENDESLKDHMALSINSVNSTREYKINEEIVTTNEEVTLDLGSISLDQKGLWKVNMCLLDSTLGMIEVKEIIFDRIK